MHLVILPFICIVRRNPMTKFLTFAATIAVVTVLAACSPTPRETEEGAFEPRKVAYFKDDRPSSGGICYGVYSFTRMDAGGRTAYGMTMATVPCEQVAGLIRSR
jgi:hypothetical protein